LQGVAVLNPGKSFYDFKPGMRLHEVMNIFLPRFEGQEDLFIMASQADRLRMSECYINSDMSCITCHNPHISVKETPASTFNNSCAGCHNQGSCSVNEGEFNLAGGNCVDCHMPPSSSIDIPHVTITDHYIRKDYSGRAYSLGSEQAEVLSIGDMRLECLTDEKPNDLTMTRGYLAFFERFHQDPVMLDSAQMYLSRVEANKLDETVHLAYLRNDMSAVRELAQETDTAEIDDPWTAYRIGEAFQAINDYGKVVPFFGRAYHLMPLNLRFADKYATALFRANKADLALPVFENLLELQPRTAKHWYNLGYYYLMKPDYEKAGLYLKKSLQLNPDYAPAQSALELLAIQTGLDK
jgi:tetratricopeptide (TPR) repeat protein